MLNLLPKMNAIINPNCAMKVIVLSELSGLGRGCWIIGLGVRLAVERGDK